MMVLLWLALLFVSCWTGSAGATLCSNASFARFAAAYQESAIIVADEILNQTVVLSGDPSTPGRNKVRAAYEKTLKVLRHQNTPDNEASFHEAFAEITSSFYDACYGPGNVSRDFSHVKRMFEIAFRDQESKDLQRAYGAVLCLKSKSKGMTKTRRKRQQPTTPCSQANDIDAFYRCISVSAPVLSRIFIFSKRNFSVAFAIDDSGSMTKEIERVKCLVKAFVKAERNKPTHYILGTFNSPGEPVLYCTLRNLSDYCVLARCK